jgi:hypothetical protein
LDRTPPGPGEYNMDETTSMVAISRTQKKGAVIQGKVLQGNSRTVVPPNFTMFKLTTTNPSGPTSCRTDSSIGKQIATYQKSAPSYSFGARTDAESIFGLPPPKPIRRRKYRKKKMYKKNTTLGYDPFVKRDPSMAISTSSVSSLAPTASTSSLTAVPSREQRHRGMGLGKVSTTFTKQYKRAHKLSRPKHGMKQLPSFYPQHFAAMRKIEQHRR